MHYSKFITYRYLFLIPAVIVLMTIACTLGSGGSPTEVLEMPTALSAPSQTAQLATEPAPTATLTLAPPTASPTPDMLSANSLPIPGGLILGNQDETLAAIEEQLQFLASGATEAVQDGDNWYYTIQVDQAGERFMWHTGWCTTLDESILSENLENLSFELSVNGQPVDLATTVSNIYTINDNLCKMYYVVVYSWPVGTTILESKVRVLKTINDGMSEIAPGDTIFTYEVTRAENTSIDSNLTIVGNDDFTFQFPSDLAQSVTTIPVEARLNSMVPNPAYTLYQFEGYPVVDSSVGAARLLVYSASEFSKISPITAEVVEMLRNLKPEEVPEQMVNGSRFDASLIPFPPVVLGNKQLFYEQFHTLDFEGGMGYAYLTQYVFEPTTEPTSTLSGLTYVFVGLGGEDVLIVGVFPVSAPNLPQGFSMEQLQALNMDDFSPQLEILNGILSSIQSTLNGTP
ncbi:MAG TPA: hypothetical protein PK530_02320 [Anaerolineales bacterium]|nr:hypothetical protein [Anaerolineales bacterium]